MKLAILGTGKIVDEVLPVLKEINGIALSAILSTPRSLEKAQKLAEIYGISQASSDYIAFWQIQMLTPFMWHFQTTCTMIMLKRHLFLGNTSFVKSHLH